MAEICADFEEDIEFTPARFFPVANQTTPTWWEKVRGLEKVHPQAPEYTEVSTIRYLHALDSLYEDQQLEKTTWINKYRHLEIELENTNSELYKAAREKLTLQHELDTCQKELHEVQQKLIAKKRARKSKKGKKTIAKIRIKNRETPYDPRQPYYYLEEYKPKESFSDQGTLETEESAADNWKIKESEEEKFGQSDADGYAQELYVLRDEQMAKRAKLWHGTSTGHSSSSLISLSSTILLFFFRISFLVPFR